MPLIFKLQQRSTPNSEPVAPKAEAATNAVNVPNSANTKVIDNLSIFSHSSRLEAALAVLEYNEDVLFGGDPGPVETNDLDKQMLMDITSNKLVEFFPGRFGYTLSEDQKGILRRAAESGSVIISVPESHLYTVPSLREKADYNIQILDELVILGLLRELVGVLDLPGIISYMFTREFLSYVINSIENENGQAVPTIQ